VTVAFLLAYAAGVGILLPRWLARATWASRAPRLAVGTWLAAAASVYGVAPLVAAVLVVPPHAVGDAVLLVVQGCGWPPPRLRAPSDPSEAVGAALLVYLAARTSYAVLAVSRTGRRERDRYRDQLRLLGRLHPRLDVVVLDHPHPNAFCVPGSGGQVVLTTGALGLLTPPELDAVVAHERAHLRGRHHAVAAAASVPAVAFPALPLFTATRREVRRLVELAADDRALQRTARVTLAEAVLRLAAPPATGTALGAASTAAAERVLRLANPHRPLGRLATAPRLVAVATLAVLPLTAVTLPAMTDLGYHCTDAVVTSQPPAVRL
jgi:Zn-dependent protease with chaperone function